MVGVLLSRQCWAQSMTYMDVYVYLLQGYYCPEGTKTYREKACPGGTYNMEFGMTDEADCKKCPSGWFCESGTADPYCDGCICPKGL